MSSIKTFTVFGDRVDVFVYSAMSSGLSSTLVQHVQPGGDPPSHSHTNEGETFVVLDEFELLLDCEFELLMDGQWHPLPAGEAAYAQRGSTHTFRNSGKTIGRIMVIVTPGGFEKYLQEIGSYSPATDMAKIIEISNRYGITFYL